MDKYNQKLDSIKLQIENTRNMLNELIEQRNFNLLDSQVIILSQLLDELLLEYDKIRK